MREFVGKNFTIQKIQDMLMNLEGFTHASSLDLNVGNYHIELSTGYDYFL